MTLVTRLLPSAQLQGWTGQVTECHTDILTGILVWQLLSPMLGMVNLWMRSLNPFRSLQILVDR